MRVSRFNFSSSPPKSQTPSRSTPTTTALAPTGPRTTIPRHTRCLSPVYEALQKHMKQLFVFIVRYSRRRSSSLSFSLLHIPQHGRPKFDVPRRTAVPWVGYCNLSFPSGDTRCLPILRRCQHMAIYLSGESRRTNSTRRTLSFW